MDLSVYTPLCPLQGCIGTMSNRQHFTGDISDNGTNDSSIRILPGGHDITMTDMVYRGSEDSQSLAANRKEGASSLLLGPSTTLIRNSSSNWVDYYLATREPTDNRFSVVSPPWTSANLNTDSKHLLNPHAIGASTSWERLRVKMTGLYLYENKKLSEVMDIMSRDHGHTAS